MNISEKYSNKKQQGNPLLFVSCLPKVYGCAKSPLYVRKWVGVRRFIAEVYAMFEKVNPCHPVKVADRIAGVLVDLAYKKVENPRIAVEVPQDGRLFGEVC